jgi:hypothetical protein
VTKAPQLQPLISAYTFPFASGLVNGHIKQQLNNQHRSPQPEPADHPYKVKGHNLEIVSVLI